MFIRLLLVFVIFAVNGCTGEVPTSPVQSWNELDFRIETRPPHIKPGMMEFLVIANREKRKPAFDLLVNLRIGDTGKWIQAIEDGHVGVYRRAVRVNDPATDVLHVYVRKGQEETVLKFPLNYALTATSD